jgi:hypothetical protein
MPSSWALVIGPEFVLQVANGHLADRQAGAIIGQTLGCEQIVGSSLVNALKVYRLPWRFVQVLIQSLPATGASGSPGRSTGSSSGWRSSATSPTRGGRHSSESL